MTVIFIYTNQNLKKLNLMLEYFLEDFQNFLVHYLLN